MHARTQVHIGPQPHADFIEYFGESTFDDGYGEVEGAGITKSVTFHYDRARQEVAPN